MISLYFHIPFCKSKCRYCDFFSLPITSESKSLQVLEETLKQFDYFFNLLNRPNVKSLYIGGGTPSILPLPQLDKLLKHLEGIALAAGEYTLEANPESLYRDLLSLCQDRGINRISLGIQSFDPLLLNRIGRITTPKEIYQALQHLETWPGSLSLDLICGLPGQSEEGLYKDLSLAIAADPDHISLYDLTIENNTPLKEDIIHGKIKDLSEYKRNLYFNKAFNYLESRGYRNYEVSNYSKPGMESLHNLGYWRMEPYLGCGPGAVATLPSQEGPVRYSNPRNLESFLQGEKNLWGIQKETLTPYQFLLEHFLMGLRTREGISFKKLASIFGLDLFSPLEELLANWKRQGYALVKESEGFAFTRKGIQRLNSFLVKIASEIDKINVPDPRWPYLDT